GPLIPAVARRPRTRAALCPDAGDGPLLTDTCFVGEPHFNRFARCFSGQRGGHEIGKPALKTTCSSGSLCGCCGRTERRRNDSLRNSLPIVRSCNSTANSCLIRCCRSTQRQRTTVSREIRTLRHPFRHRGPLFA